jgi:hypothetical protein
MLRATRDKAGGGSEEAHSVATNSNGVSSDDYSNAEGDASAPPAPLHVAFVMDVSGDTLSEDADPGSSPGGGKATYVSRLAAMAGAVRYLAADAAPSGVTVLLCDPSLNNNSNNSDKINGNNGGGVVQVEFGLLVVPIALV